MYINLTLWAIALASILFWARFAVWMVSDVRNLASQSVLLWKAVSLAVLGAMIGSWLYVSNTAASLMLCLVVVAGAVAAYWYVRVAELGASGHLFGRLIKIVGKAGKKIEQTKASRQVSLSYLKPDDTPLPLPGPEDPIAAGLGLADQILLQAMDKRAEQVDLMPSGDAYGLTFHVDGVPYPQPNMQRAAAEPIMQALKKIAGLAVEERRRPQQGVFRVRDKEQTVTAWTTRSSGTTAGERLSLYANEVGRWDMQLDQLGLAADQLAALKALTKDTEGVVMVAAPRGTGRTTTLYALIRAHDAFVNTVQTLELNPQADIEGVTVHKYDQRTSEASYAKALQSILLKDPNVVLVAECPDPQTAENIVRYGSEGHRLYVGFPAFDTATALEMWLKLASDRHLAISGLRAIVSQRLIRILCPTCRIAYQPDDMTLKKLNLPIGRNLQAFRACTEPITDAKGNRVLCPDCGGTGYRGRTGIFEVLIMTDEIRKAIVEGANLQNVKTLARKDNMMLLVEHGIRKFATGMTSMNEVLRVVTPEQKSAASGATEQSIAATTYR